MPLCTAGIMAASSVASKAIGSAMDGGSSGGGGGSSSGGGGGGGSSAPQEPFIKAPQTIGTIKADNQDDTNSALSSIVSGAGQGRDTQVAHVSPDLQQQLRGMDGSGTINPYTGLKQYITNAEIESQFGGQKDIQAARQADPNFNLANWYQDFGQNEVNSGARTPSAPPSLPAAAPAPAPNIPDATIESQFGKQRDIVAARQADPNFNLAKWYQDFGQKEVAAGTRTPYVPNPTLEAQFGTQPDIVAAKNSDPSFDINDWYKNYGQKEVASGVRQPTGSTPVTPKTITPTINPWDQQISDLKNQISTLTKNQSSALTNYNQNATPAPTTNTQSSPEPGTITNASPLANVTPLSPVRPPRFRSRKSAGGSMGVNFTG